MERKRGTKIIQVIQIILVDSVLLSPLIYSCIKKKRLKEALKQMKIERMDRIQLTKKSIKLVLILMAIAFLVSVASSMGGVNDLEKVSETVKELNAVNPFLLLYYLTVRVTSEEIFFRGFLTRKTGVLVSSVAFGLAHFMYGSVIQVFGAFIAGIFLAHYFKENNNLLPNILGHMAYNAIGLILVS
jgi:hypothetical protein